MPHRKAMCSLAIHCGEPGVIQSVNGIYGMFAVDRVEVGHEEKKKQTNKHQDGPCSIYHNPDGKMKWQRAGGVPWAAVDCGLGRRVLSLSASQLPSNRKPQRERKAVQRPGARSFGYRAHCVKRRGEWQEMSCPLPHCPVTAPPPHHHHHIHAHTRTGTIQLLCSQ